MTQLPLGLMPQDHLVLDEYCEESDTCHHLADLEEQFQQPKKQFASKKSNTAICTLTEEMLQLTDKLQHLPMVLQPAL